MYEVKECDLSTYQCFLLPFLLEVVVLKIAQSFFNSNTPRWAARTKEQSDAELGLARVCMCQPSCTGAIR